MLLHVRLRYRIDERRKTATRNIENKIASFKAFKWLEDNRGIHVEGELVPGPNEPILKKNLSFRIRVLQWRISKENRCATDIIMIHAAISLKHVYDMENCERAMWRGRVLC